MVALCTRAGAPRPAGLPDRAEPPAKCVDDCGVGRELANLLVEQNAKVALETAHYGYVLEIGRVVMNDTCERLMNSKDIQEFYLGAKEEGARGERRWKKKKTWR